MNKTLKGIILFTALLLPVLIFFFLKMFGKNEFDIPIYNHTELTSTIPCDNIKLPHTVDLNTTSANISNDGIGNIYQVLQVEDENQLKQMMRVKDRFEGQPVSIITLLKADSSFNTQSAIDKYQISDNWKLHQIEEGLLNNFRDCELMLEKGTSLALVDSEGKLRGYYDGSDLKEVDRLILETKILIYKNE